MKLGGRINIREQIDPDWQELEQADEPIEMANLPPSQTGIDGVIFVSTRMGPRGPRVKYYERPGLSQPSFAISISDAPAVGASSLPQRVVDAMAPKVAKWVLLNQPALLEFWHHGDSWLQPWVEGVLRALKPLPGMPLAASERLSLNSNPPWRLDRRRSAQVQNQRYAPWADTVRTRQVDAISDRLLGMRGLPKN